MTRVATLAPLAVALALAAPAAAEVRIASTSDASRCTPVERAQNLAALRRALDKIVASSSGNAHVDATLESVTVTPNHDALVVSARVRLAISDDTGRILSVLAGGATVEQHARGAHAHGIRALRHAAVTAAVDSHAANLRGGGAGRPAPDARRPALR